MTLIGSFFVRLLSNCNIVRATISNSWSLGLICPSSWFSTCIPSYVQVFIAPVPRFLLEKAFTYGRRVRRLNLVRIRRKFSLSDRGHYGAGSLHTLIFRIAVICGRLRPTHCFPTVREICHCRSAQGEALLLCDLQSNGLGHGWLNGCLFLRGWDDLMFIRMRCCQSSLVAYINIWKCRLLLFPDWYTFRTTWGIFGAKIVSST